MSLWQSAQVSRTNDSRPSLARDTRNLTQRQAVKYLCHHHHHYQAHYHHHNQRHHSHTRHHHRRHQHGFLNEEIEALKHTSFSNPRGAVSTPRF